MGNELSHRPVKLIIPVLYSDRAILDLMLVELKERFGTFDYISEPFVFETTNYYADEMEGVTFRQFISFEKLIPPEYLVQAKLITNRIELAHAVNGKRKVNLDPGYMELGKFVLATTKDQQHRLYIGESIFEEITLFYRDKKWCHWEWTYPDYRTERYKEIFTAIRSIYKKQLDNR